MATSHPINTSPFQVVIQTRKILVPRDRDSDPELDPLYSNRTEVMAVGDDIFLDFGIVKPSDINALNAQSVQADAGGSPPIVDFYVLERIVISRWIFSILLQQMAQLNQTMILAEKEAAIKSGGKHE